MKKINDDTIPRAKALLEQMSLDEKLYQLSSQMLYSVDENYEEKREHREGNFRNPSHFMHFDKSEPVTTKEVAARINRDVKLSMEVQPHGIPPIEHGEALHGVQWGMATCFPQPIAMAATFDDELVAEIGDVIGKEWSRSFMLRTIVSKRYKKTEEQFAKIGASIEYLPYTHGVSTSDIKNQIKK